MQPVRTLTLFTHVQPGYDRNAVSRQACQKLIQSGRAGQILEHRVDCYEPWLTHGGRLWQTRKWQVLDGCIPVPNEAELAKAHEGLGLAETGRFIFCGGSLPMPPETYRPGWTGAGTCHHISFRVVLDGLLPLRRSVEFHFPPDAIYCLQFPNANEAAVMSLNPRHEAAGLLAYTRRLDVRRVAYNYYHGSEEAKNFRPGGLSSVFFWESAEAMLEAFARRENMGSY